MFIQTCLLLSYVDLSFKTKVLSDIPEVPTREPLVIKYDQQPLPQGLLFFSVGIAALETLFGV